MIQCLNSFVFSCLVGMLPPVTVDQLDIKDKDRNELPAEKVVSGQLQKIDRSLQDKIFLRDVEYAESDLLNDSFDSGLVEYGLSFNAKRNVSGPDLTGVKLIFPEPKPPKENTR